MSNEYSIMKNISEIRDKIVILVGNILENVTFCFYIYLEHYSITSTYNTADGTDWIAKLNIYFKKKINLMQNISYGN